MAGPRILLVEDEFSISEPFSRLLSREGFEPVVAPTVTEALDEFIRCRPDLILLDLTLPDGDGRDVAREVRRESEVPIIMLTARGTETDRIVGLEIGADDYVVKPFSSAEVIARIRAVLRRAPAATESEDGDEREPLEVRGLRIEPASRKAVLDSKELELSRKEFDLLVELAYASGDVITRDELMRRVWDENWFGSTKTLDVHVGWLRKKLGDDASRPTWIETVRGVGFRLADADR